MSCTSSHSCPVLGDFLSVQQDVKTIQGTLTTWLHTQKHQRRTRDRLAYELEELQDVVEENLVSRDNADSCPDPDHLSLEEKIVYFLDWRNELQILHSSIARSLAIARRMHGNRREETQDLQDIHDDITDYLCDTDYLHEKAREKLQEIRRPPEPPRPRPSGRDSGYQSPRVNTLSSLHGSRCLTNIVNDAERIRADSMETSLKMENEVESLKAKSLTMAKDLVALNKVIERQKRELVDLTRMKRSNERAERELEHFY